MESITPSTPGRLHTIQARVMFALSIVFLILLAGVFHRHQLLDLHILELQIQVLGLAILWPVFIGEAIWRFFQRDRTESIWKHLGFACLVYLFPPLRIGARSPHGGKLIWLPWLRWQEVDRELQRRLERFFSPPMILIALMVLPLLAIQHFWAEQVETYEALELVLAVGNGIIWFAFALEFIIMSSVARNKFRYCMQHWVDIAIIVLPIFQSLPLLRLLRAGGVLRLEQLTRMSRIYRLQGVSLKAWRAVLLLEVIQRLTGQTMEKRLRRLKDLQTVKEEELEELRQEIEELHKLMADQKLTAGVRDASDGRP